MSKFANRLISLRKERNLTQEDIAKIIYKKRSTVSGYETEGKQPDLDTVCLLAKYFGVSTDYLLGYTDRPNHSEDVFYNDTVNFQKHFNNLPTELRPAVSKCFDDFYRAPKPGYAVRSPGSVSLSTRNCCVPWQSLRSEIQKKIEATGGAVTDPVVLSDLMALQSQLKNEIASLLDRLMQADMEIAFNVKNGVTGAFSGKTAM